MTEPRYLFPNDYMADPAPHVFGGRLYVYPSHDRESGIPENDNGDHFDMNDYHVLSFNDLEHGTAVDHGVILKVADIPWAGRQLWDNDVVEKDGRYHMYFSLKDKNDVFHLGHAVADRPEGPFVPDPDPIRGSYSIDPCVFKDDDGACYVTFGGLWGGQLQRYRGNKAVEKPCEPADSEAELPPHIVKLGASMAQFAEEPRALVILDPATKKPLTAGDHDRRFFEASWLHKRNGVYYYSYSTGDTHFLCYATSKNVYGPYIYRGVILKPVVGWTTHHGICEFQGKWWLFHHDCVPSGGKTWLRSLKVAELRYNADGTIQTVN